MASGRTDVLIRGAGTAVAVPQPILVRGSVSVPTPTILTTNGARFPGDPGTKILHGLNSISDSQFNAVQTAVGRTFKMRRTYNGADFGWNLAEVDQDIAAGRIAVTSFKLSPYTLTTVPDSAIDAMITQAKARAPHVIWAVFYHEPEENFPDATNATNYRALYRRIVLRFRAQSVTNVAWSSPYFMTPFTFTSGSGRDWRWWHPDWNGGNTNTSADFFTGSNAVCDMDGFDLYCPLIGSTNYQSVGTSLGKAKTAMAANGYTMKPILIGELGYKCQDAPPPVGLGASGDPLLIPSKMDDGWATAKADNWVGMCWYSNGGNSFLHGPVPANDPNGEKEHKLATIVADPRSG